MPRYEKGSSKEQDPNEIRKCKDCGQEKVVTEFVKGKGNLYRFKCKECRAKERRTGKTSQTRFQKGHDKGKRFEKGHTPWFKLRDVPHPGINNRNPDSDKRFTSYKYKEWRKQVIQRGGRKCARCSIEKKLAVHHIKPWKEDESLRFDATNGMVLCNSCHGKEEGFKPGHVTYLSEETRKQIGLKLRGKKITEEQKRKISEAKKGKPSPMKGRKMTEQSKLLMSLAKLGKPCSNGFKKNNIPWNKGMKNEINQD